MSDKQNLAAKVIRDWQDQFQECLKDPRLIDLMTENYARFQQTISQTASNDSPSAGSPIHDDSDAQLHEFGKRLSEIESRLSFIEGYIKGNTKSKP